jgi:peptidoglycan hydrolase-like protein with peptidoglycan-binding domain
VRIIRNGDRGEAVRDIQHRLTELGHRVDPAELEGEFGPSTQDAVRSFQAARRLPVDGIVGADTWNQLVEAGYRLGDRTLYLRSPAFRGDDVRALQRMLNALGFDAGKEDGILGRHTADAVMEFQRNLRDRWTSSASTPCTLSSACAPRSAGRASRSCGRRSGALDGHLARGCDGRDRRREPGSSTR